MILELFLLLSAPTIEVSNQLSDMTRFASVGRNRAANYTRAGVSVKNEAAKAFDAARSSSPDYGKLAETGMKANSYMKRAAMNAEAQVAKAGVSAVGKVQSQAFKADIAESKSKTQMAGKLAAMSAASGAFSKKGGLEKPIEPVKGPAPTKAKIVKPNYDSLKVDVTPFTPTKVTTYVPPGKRSGGASNGSPKTSNVSSKSLTSSTNISASERRMLDIMGKWESDGVGSYNAINQVGIKGGHGTLGYSGDIRDMGQHGGRALTDFTVGEIMDLQNNSGSNRQLSNQEWIDAGRLHAVGRYQFIGPTFAAAVQRQGISRDTKFTPEVQDRLALNHLNGAGSMSQWTGPSTHMTDSERAEVNNYFANL